MRKAEIVAPITEGLIRIHGKSISERVENITLQGLTFQHDAWNLMEVEGSRGFGMVDVSCPRFPETSESLNARSEAVAQAEVERYQRIAKSILIENRDFLDKAITALIEKETLLYSDIQAIKAETTIKKSALIA